MKSLLVCFVVLFSTCHVSASWAGGASIFINILDLSLSISNVVTGGCSYYPEICTLKNSIEAMEDEIRPKLVVLDRLDKENSVLYRDLTDVLANNNDLSQQSGNLQFLVVSITRRLGNSVQTYERLALEYEANTNRLLLTYREDIDRIKQQAVTKTIILGSLTGAQLLYKGLKFVYIKLKASGKIGSPWRFRSAVSRVRPASLALRPLTNPRWYRAKQSFTRFKTWWNKPEVAKIRRYVKSAGVLVGSLFSIGVSTTVDVIMARRMRDTLRNTEAELRDIKNHIDHNIMTETTTNRNLKASFVTARKSFSDLSSILGSTILPSGITPARILTKRTPGSMLPLQRRVIDAFAEYTRQLQLLDLEIEVQQVIQLAVEFDDSLRRISYTLRRNGYLNITEAQILRAIAKANPNMTSYDGRALAPYRY